MSIKNIQKVLKEQGLYSNNIDGIWGPASQLGMERILEKGSHKLYFDFQSFKTLFNQPKLSQDFVDNINYLFEGFAKWRSIGGANPLFVSYMLATTWHETAHTMKPVRERGSDQYLSKYGVGKLAKVLGNSSVEEGIKFAGRGYVQITGKTNYKKFSDFIGVDLVSNPDYTLHPRVAADILIVGSLRGMFTGRRLSDYIRRGFSEEFRQARRVINGKDKADLIASHAVKFLSCLTLVEVKPLS